MKIAITYENEKVFQHFGHTEKVKVYTVENNKVISAEVLDTNGAGHELLVNFLKDNGVEVLICGGIGAGAKVALEKAGIKLFGGVSGNCDEILTAYLNKSLKYNPDTTCTHHHMEGEHHCKNHNRCTK